MRSILYSITFSLTTIWPIRFETPQSHTFLFFYHKLTSISDSKRLLPHICYALSCSNSALLFPLRDYWSAQRTAYYPDSHLIKKSYLHTFSRITSRLYNLNTWPSSVHAEHPPLVQPSAIFHRLTFLDLIIQALDYSKYSGSSILGLCHWCSVSYTRYISFSTLNLALPSQVLIHLIVLSEPIF